MHVVIYICIASRYVFLCDASEYVQSVCLYVYIHIHERETVERDTLLERQRDTIGRERESLSL